MTIETLPVNHGSIPSNVPDVHKTAIEQGAPENVIQSKIDSLQDQKAACSRNARMPGGFGSPNSPYSPTKPTSSYPNNNTGNLSPLCRNGSYAMSCHSSPSIHGSLEPHTPLQQTSPSMQYATAQHANHPQTMRHHHSLSLQQNTLTHSYGSNQPNQPIQYSERKKGYHYRQSSQPIAMYQTRPLPPINSPSPSTSTSGFYPYHQGSGMTGQPTASQKFGQMNIVTHQDLAAIRKDAIGSNDPRQMLDFVKLLLEASCVLPANEQDQSRGKKMHDDLVTEAKKIVKKLAGHSGIGKQGYAEAQYFLANCYGTGTMGLPTDAEKAFSFYFQGAKQSHPGCTYRAAVCYEVGAGTKRDKDHAMKFYRKAANLGDQAAMYKLGVILLKGFLGQPKNPREAISWLKRAAQNADENHPHALHELGLAFEKEGIPSVIPDLDYARELFTQAAQYGYAPSQFKLGLAYENGFLNCPVDPRRSIAWYSKAAQQGDVEAEFALSGWYLTGAEGILQQSDKEAYLWARKAADKGNAKAEYAVGYFTETGTGVKQNLEEAKRWYMRASAQDYGRATQRLTELKYNGTVPRQRKRYSREHNTSSSTHDSECTIM